MAKLYFKYGTMNSGKTTELLQIDYNYKEKGFKSIIMKPEIDLKGESKITSRLGVERKADYLIGEESSIISLLYDKENLSLDCLLVDEVQFLNTSQIDELFILAVRYDIPVICYGLRTDFSMKGFEGSSRLLEIAHSLEEIKTICSCGKKATQNARIIDGKHIFEGEQIVIDNNKFVEYESLCGKCYLDKKFNS